MLKIKDLTVSKEMNAPEMAGIRGGLDPFAAIDFSTSFDNKVADVKQLFAFEFAQGNAGAVTNNQAILGGNGIIYAPVHQEQSQGNYMDVSRIGNVSVS
jgi:hypothetical protein